MTPILIPYDVLPAAWVGASVGEVLKVEEVIRGWTLQRHIQNIAEALSQRRTPQPSWS